MRLSATQFLHKNNFEGKFFILFGEEEILKVKTSKKILKNQEIHSEKIKLDLEDDDFEKIIQNFLFSNSLFSCLLYTSPSPRDLSTSRMPSSA